MNTQEQVLEQMDTTEKQDESSTEAKIPYGQGIRIERSMTISRAQPELYAFWRNFENLPLVMKHLEYARDLGNGRSHWVAHAPGNTHVEWDAEIIEDVENEKISWRSIPDADVMNAGSVQFSPAPAGRGTIVKVVLEYEPPAGKLGQIIAKLFGEEPEQQIKDDLRRFKQYVESGEIATTEGQPEGNRNVLSKLTKGDS